MGGTQPEVLTTLTTDFGKVIDGLHRTKIRGKAHFSTALNVGQLALKHRQNKSQHQRIVIFTCSPLSEEEGQLVKLAKRLKKNNIAVDVVAIGDLEDETVKKVEAFHNNIKSSAPAGATNGDAPAPSDDQSNLAIIPPGPNLLSDSLVPTPILAGTGVGGASGFGGGGAGGADGDADGSGGGGGGGEGFEFGVDPNADPELALALRMSMQEEEQKRQREERERAEKEGEGAKLESVPEEGGSGSGEGSGSGSTEKKEDYKKDGEGGGEDKMDTS